MDPISTESVQHKCAMKPWCLNANPDALTRMTFGSVPQDYESEARKYPTGSDERKIFKDAARIARDIYKRQAALILNEDFVRKLCDEYPFCRNPRTAGFVEARFGKVPEFYEKAAESFSEGSDERELAYDMAALARDIYREQVKATLDPDKAEDLAAAEPWNDQPLQTLREGMMGYVPEKFIYARNLFPEDSEDYRSYNQGYEDAWRAYNRQMFATARAYYYSVGGDRAQLEVMGLRLFELHHQYEDQMNRTGNKTYLNRRFLYVASAMGEVYYAEGKIAPSQPGVQRMKFTASGGMGDGPAKP